MKILVVVLAIVVGGSLFVAALSVYKPDAIRNGFDKSYSVVYLSNGEVYVGRLSTFPKLVLRNPYVLQSVANPDDPAQKSIQLAPLKEAFWSPDDRIYLNREHIIYTASIRKDSKIAQDLKAESSKTK